MLPTLLASAFADRLFYHPFLSLAGLPLRGVSDAAACGIMVDGLGHVATCMVNAIAGTRAADGVDPASVERALGEICTRVVPFIRVALLVLRTSDELQRLAETLHVLVDSVTVPDARPEALDDLLGLALVVELVLGRPDPDWLDTLCAHLFRSASSDSSGSTRSGSPGVDLLVHTLQRHLCPRIDVDGLLAICDALPATAWYHSEMCLALLHAGRRYYGSRTAARARVEERLDEFAASRSTAGGEASAPESGNSEGTDYDEPRARKNARCGGGGVRSRPPVPR